MPEEKSAVSCPYHARQGNDGDQSDLDNVMRTLPDKQGGAGRHKCPYCAYESGYRQAIRDVTAWASERLPRQAS